MSDKVPVNCSICGKPAGEAYHEDLTDEIKVIGTVVIDGHERTLMRGRAFWFHQACARWQKAEVSNDANVE